MAGVEELELKERVNHLIAVLCDFLPDDFEQTAEEKSNRHRDFSLTGLDILKASIRPGEAFPE